MIGRRGFSYGLGLVSFGVLALSAAQAAEGEFLRDAMSGIGLIEPERPTITYNERAPLVMPPALGGKAGKPTGKRVKNAPQPDEAMSLSLPPPQTRQADPQWPKDPEIVQRERAAIEAKRPIVTGAQGRTSDNNMTLSPYEMQAGRRAGAGLNTERAGTPGDARGEASWLNPLQLFSGRKDDAEPSAIEPEREVLSDPPMGYRKAPVKIEKAQGLPVGNSISGNEEADPRTYMREQQRR